MKHTQYNLLIAAVVIAFSPFYVAQAQGGFMDTNKTTPLTHSSQKMTPSSLANLNTTVNQLNAVQNKSYVILEGMITEQIKGEDYLFKDNTGTVNVDIDHSLWKGIKATPTTKLRLLGKVEHKRNNGLEINVVQLELAN